MMLDNLKAATNLHDLARLLQVKPGMLSYILYTKPKTDLYTKFEIPKRTGGAREISAPSSHLKLIQHRLAKVLDECSQEILKKYSKKNSNTNFEYHDASHGFVSGHNIMTNGQAHITRRYVFNADLSDFFGSINFGRVRGFFIKDKNFNLPQATATVIAQIACHENKLPQGSPCSPIISNLLGHILDIALIELAKKNSCIYTRYADDLTFSTNKAEFPSPIAIQSDEDLNIWLPGKRLTQVVQRNGFLFNEKKTRMQYKDSRQEVTGLSVNRKVNVSASYRYTVRAMANTLFRTGAFEHIHTRKKIDGTEVISRANGSVQQLLGMLSFIHQVDMYNEAIAIRKEKIPIKALGRIELYRRSIYFNSFYAPDRPVIICEGKTDNVYIKHAICRLATEYPLLAEMDESGELKLSIRLFKYAEQRTASVTKISGGVGGLCHLIKSYHDDVMKKFSAPRPSHPVIILIDNDSGRDAIYGAIAGVLNIKKPEGKKPFIHVFSNLYVVPTPPGPNGEKTSIEDFFDTATLSVELNGKTFSKKNDTDVDKNYGKSAFARDVIAKNSDQINFDGFKPILARIELAIADYYKNM